MYCPSCSCPACQRQRAVLLRNQRKEIVIQPIDYYKEKLRVNYDWSKRSRWVNGSTIVHECGGSESENRKYHEALRSIPDIETRPRNGYTMYFVPEPLYP